MKVKILGFNIDNVTMGEALDKIEEFVSSRIPHRLSLPHPYALLKARKHPELGRYINTADLVLPDGFGLILASRFYGNPIKKRVSGTDLMYELSALAAKKGWKMFFLGAKDGVAKRAAEILCQHYPGLQIVGIHHGYFSRETKRDIVRDIINKKPDILVVCLGVYKQEMFIDRHMRELNVPVSFGNGGAFRVIAGDIKRAPYWMQKHGLEWLFRLIQEPKDTWKRYLIGNPVFLLLALREIIKKRMLGKNV